MGKKFLKFLDEDHVYVCSNKKCGTHLSSPSQTVSKLFQGKFGNAYLFKEVVNILLGPIRQKRLITGLHLVADIYCINCQQYVGWKYFHASVEDQKYKVDKFILEISKLRSNVRPSPDRIDQSEQVERPESRRSPYPF